jgi:hypothetical protein
VSGIHKEVQLSQDRCFWKRAKGKHASYYWQGENCNFLQLLYDAAFLHANSHAAGICSWPQIYPHHELVHSLAEYGLAILL